MSPRISILLPFYNAQATLTATLESIAAQTFTDYEVIAVDDGSTDESAAIVHAHALRDARIRLLQPGRGGVVHALNHGLTACRAPWVARIDADDLMYPQRLAAQYELLQQRPHLGLIGCQVRSIPEETLTDGFREYLRWQNACTSEADIAHDIYVEMPIAQPSVMFVRDVVREAGGYRHGDFPEDYELLLRLHRAGVAMAKVPQVLLDWRDTPGRATRTDQRYAREAFDRLRVQYLAEDARLHEARPLVICGAGRRTRQRANLLLDRGFSVSAWIDIDPRKIGNTVRGARVHPPHWLDRADKPFVLGYVTNHGARDVLAAQLHDMGYCRGSDYLMVG